MSEIVSNDEAKEVPVSPVYRKRRAKLCFGLGDVQFIGLLDGNSNQIMSVIDDLSTSLTEDIGIYWFNHTENKYERVTMWSELE